MKIHFAYLILLFSILASCSSDSESVTTQNSNIFINEFTTKIKNPIQLRDYSYDNQGYYGIFENPNDSKTFNGEIDISYENNSTQLHLTDIQVIWKSNLDGILFEGNPDENFESEIISNLSVGTHTIYLEVAIPNENLIAKDSIILSNNIELTTTNTALSVRLNWTQYEGNDFESYLVYREDHTPIAEIQNINTLEYEDSDFNIFPDEYAYQIIVKTSGNHNHPIGSNIEAMNPGNFLRFPYSVSKIVNDPLRNKIYGIINPYPLNENDKYGIVIIDSDTFEVDSHILIDKKFADFDMSPDKQYLFIGHEEVDGVTRLNLDTMESTFTGIYGTHPKRASKVEVDENNIVYVEKHTLGSSNFFWIFDGNNGTLLNQHAGFTSYSGSDIEYNTLNHKLYSSAQTQNITGRVFRWSIEDNDLNLDFAFPDLSNYILYSADLYLSNDNQTIFWHGRKLDLDLNIIGFCPEGILSSSPDDEYISNNKNLFKNNFDATIVLEYPTSSLINKTSTVFTDNNTLVLKQLHTSINGAQEEYTTFMKIKFQ
jgi:hypothetical protein